MRIIVTGMVGHYPVGGVAWDYLQYVIGLAPAKAIPFLTTKTPGAGLTILPKRPTPPTQHFSANYLCEFFVRYAPELRERWHYLHLHPTSYGMSRRSKRSRVLPTCFSMSAGHQCFPSSWRQAA